MANWCSTDYYYVGDKKKIQKLHDDIGNRMEKVRSELKKESGSYIGTPEWLGYTAELIGRKWEDISCRGEILEYSDIYKEYGSRDYVISIATETAWTPCYELMMELAKKYGVKHYFYAEEIGCGIYETNDKEKRFFTSRFKIIREDEDEYMDTFEEVADEVEKTIGKRPKDFDEADKMCGGYSEGRDDVLFVEKINIVDVIDVYSERKKSGITINVTP